MLRSKECANVNLDVNVNESGSVHQNVSESAILELGNESVTGQNVNDCDRGDRAHHHRQTHFPFRRAWVKVVHENAHVHDCDRHANVNVPTRG